MPKKAVKRPLESRQEYHLIAYSWQAKVRTSAGGKTTKLKEVEYANEVTELKPAAWLEQALEESGDDGRLALIYSRLITKEEYLRLAKVLG